MQEQADLAQYMRIVKRRKWFFILPAVLILAISVTVALALPAVYRAEATIVVEAQEIPEEMVKSTVTGFVEEHLQAIKQVVLSRSNLLQLMDRFNLYPDMRDSSTTQELAGKMRDAISLEPVQAEVSNPRAGRQITATVAFVLAFEGKEPRTVARVTNTLASQLIEENSRHREHKAESTVLFLRDRLEQIDRELAATETRIAGFKDRHMHSLPELMQVNLQALERMQERMDHTREQINTLEDRRIYLEGQLATLEPGTFLVNAQGQRVMTALERLEILSSEYLGARASLSENHPDVVSLKKQREALEKEVQTRDELRNVRNELDAAQTDLAALHKKYSPIHPDVVQARKRLQELEQRAEELAVDRAVSGNEEPAAENPAYIELQTRIRATAMELEAAKKEIISLGRKYDQIQARIEKAPRVEQEYAALQRDYANQKAEHQETKARLIKASEAQELEQGRVSQKLRLVDPPAVPEAPAKPNRLALVLVGAVLGAGCGVGSGSLAEFLDRAVHSVQELAGVTKQPVLAGIPYLETIRDRKKRLIKRLIFLACLIALTAAVLWTVHVMIAPLDLLWSQAVQK